MENKMNKLMQALLFGAMVGVISGCGGSSSGNSGNTNNWNLVGGSNIPGSNTVLNSIVYGNGQVYTGGSVDVNNPAVFNYVKSWQITGGNYLPNPNGATEQVNSIAIDNNKTLYAAVNVTMSGSFGYRPTVGYLANNSGNGGSWVILANESGVPDNGGINSISVSNGTTYAGTGGYDLNNNVYYGHVYSCAGAQSPWQAVGGESVPNGGQVYSVALSNTSSVYAGTGGYDLTTNSSFGSVYVSINNGSWQQVGGGAIPDSGVVTSLAISPTNQIYAATSNGNVYLSTGNSSWSLFGGGSLPNNSSITSINLSSNGLIYAASNNGNIYAAAINQPWQLVGGGGMPDGWYANAITTASGVIYAATQGGNVYSTKISQ